MLRRTHVALAAAAAVAVTLIGFAPADAAVPDITDLSASPATIYPNINNATRPGFSTITITGDPTTVADLEVRNASSTKVADIFPGNQSTASWDGRSTVDPTHPVVPAGVYTVYAIGTGSDVSPHTATITVSTKKLVLKTYKATVTAAASTIGKFVGSCSTLRKPSKRGWKGSLGYYGNTKCAAKSFTKAAVFTVNSVKVPVAERYVDVRVNLYGGAAKAAKKSRGILMYFDKTQSNVFGALKLTKTLGTHTGRTVSATNMITSARQFVWSFETAGPKQQYDVKNFTVVVRYYVLG